MESHYIVGAILLFITILYELRKFFGYRNIVGLELSLVYQESNFHPNQRVSGVVIKKIKIGSGTHFIVKLNNPIYHDQKANPAIIIKEKNGSPPIGSFEISEIHVYLPLVNLNKNRFSLPDFEHIGWGLAEKLSKTQ